MYVEFCHNEHLHQYENTAIIISRAESNMVIYVSLVNSTYYIFMFTHRYQRLWEVRVDMYTKIAYS